MRNKLFAMGMISMLLAFGMVLISCPDGSTTNGTGNEFENEEPDPLQIYNTNGSKYQGGG
jgi:hypothetical protein